jgi:hypothetical protein
MFRGPPSAGWVSRSTGFSSTRRLIYSKSRHYKQAYRLDLVCSGGLPHVLRSVADSSRRALLASSGRRPLRGFLPLSSDVVGGSVAPPLGARDLLIPGRSGPVFPVAPANG